VISEDALWYQRGDLVEFKLNLGGGPKTCRGLVLNTAVLVGRGARQIWILDMDDATNELQAPKFGNGIAFNDASGESRAILYLDTTGAPHLLLRDDKGQPLVSLPEAPKGTGAK
jgi:hypothetical protein